VVGHAAVRVSAPGRRRSHRQICWFRCAEGYHTSIDMPTALHPQTLMTFKFDGEILPTKYGFPMKVRIPTKLGFKNPKHVMRWRSSTTGIPATGKRRATTGSAAARIQNHGVMTQSMGAVLSF